MGMSMYGGRKKSTFGILTPVGELKKLMDNHGINFILDNIDIDDIQKYLRSKKIKRIRDGNNL